MKAWIVYRKKDVEKNEVFIKYLIESCAKNSVQASLIIREKIVFGILDDGIGLSYDGERVSELPAFSINRCADSFLSKSMEQMGIRVFNNSQVCEICNDKARTHRHLAKTGVKQLETLFFNKDNFNPAFISFAYPFVAKPTDLSGGKDVCLIKNEKELVQYVERIQSANFIIQKLSGTLGKDLRVYVVGNEIVVSILRFSNSDFRSNYGLGGDFTSYSLSDFEKQIVKKIICEFDFGLVGIDFLFDGEGQLIFNEIEDSVGCKMLYQNNTINIAEEYVSFILISLTKCIC